MTQLFTNEGLGISGSSIGQLGNYGPKGKAELGHGGEFIYMNAANGNLVLRQTDGFLASAGVGFEVIQSYNSLGEGGKNWQFNTETSLSLHGTVNNVGSELTRIDADGHATQFIFNAIKGCYVDKKGGIATLIFKGNHWTYREGSSVCSYEYNVDGQLTKLTDRDGHQLQFYYRNGQLDSIVDNSGKQLIKWTFNQGLLQDLTVMSEGVIVHHLHYDYDEENRLSKVSRDIAEGKSYWISYDYVGDSNRISTIRQSDGTALFIDYDEEGRVKKLVDGENRTTTYHYFDGKTLITDSKGETWTYFYDQQSRLTGIDGPENSRIRYKYEGNHLTEIYQGDLHWLLHYNEAGDCISIEEPTGQITSRLYDEEHHLLSETHYASFGGNHHPTIPNTQRFVYDEKGHLRFKIASDGTVSEYRYNQEGQCISSRLYLQSSYDVGQLTREQSPQLDELLRWVSAQNAQAITLTTYHYDWRGLLDEEMHYTSINANGEGQLDGAIATYFRYDAAGRLLEKAVPVNGKLSTTSYVYDDLGRLIQRIDNHNHSQRFEYDDRHQRTIETDANGLQTIRTYDRSGLLLTTQYLDSGQQNYGTVYYTYDEAGRLQSETNVDGSITYYFYDHEGRLQAKCEPGGHLIEYHYDENGRLIQTLRFHDTVSTVDWPRKIPLWSAIRPEANAKDRTSQTVYNAYNQVAYQIDAKGAVLAFEYDPAGRVISKTAYAIRLSDYKGQILSFETLKPQMSAKDRCIHYFYDEEGRLLAEVNAEGAATAFRYDRAGHIVETIRYANRLNFPLEAQWVAPRSSFKDIHSRSLYNAAGLKVADINPLGFVITYEYNERGLLIEKYGFSTALSNEILANINETTPLSNLAPKKTAADHVTSYAYDDLDQLIEERSQNGLLTQFRYDEKGLILEKTMIDTKTAEIRQQRFRYDAMGRISHRLDEIGAYQLLKAGNLTQEECEAIWQHHSLRYSYDLAGRLMSVTNGLNQTTRYFYNEAGLLNYTVNADGHVIEYQYNAFNQIAMTRRYRNLLKEKSANLSFTELADRLKGLRDEASDEITYYEYNSLGQLVKKLTGRSGQQTIHYNAFGDMEETHLQLDASHEQVQRYSYDRRGLLRFQIDDIGGLNRKTEIQYDVFGRIEKSIDGRGGITSYGLNRRGEQIMIENQAKHKKQIYYDAFGRILRETNYASKDLYAFLYDDRNNTLTLEHPGEKNKVVTQFNAFGDKITVTDANGNTTHYAYDVKGQLLSVNGPEESTKHYHYNEAGNLVWKQDSNGQKIRYWYDAEGHVLSKTVDPEGLALTTRYQYDGIGRQLLVTEANGLRKQFSYDDRGNLIQTCIDPEGLSLTTRFDYDDRGLLIRQTEFNPQGKHKITAYEWDALGRRKATVLDPEGLKLTTRYKYDENDNLISETDAINNTRRFVYDAKNQCRFQIDARGAVIEHVYNVHGHEERTIAYANRIPALDDYTEATLHLALIPSEKDQYQFRLHDREGRLIVYFDALGYGTSYSYDDNGNLVHQIRFAKAQSLDILKSGRFDLPEEVEERHQYFAYNGLNQLIYQLDEKNNLTQYSYNAYGQLTAKTQFAQALALEGNVYSLEVIRANLKPSSADQCTRYAYDAAGRLSHQLSANGIVSAYFYDASGNRLASLQYATLLERSTIKNNWQNQILACSHDRLTRAIYDAAGREVYRISAEGRVLERRYDALGNVIKEIAHFERLNSSARAESDLRPLLEVDKKDSMTSFQYDEISRLVIKTDANQQTTRYRYDNNNNLLAKVEANLAEWTYVYDEANQLIETYSPSTSILSFQAGRWVSETRTILTQNSYDSFGNIISTIRDVNGLNQTIHYVYDNNNRKIKTIYPDVLLNAASNQASANRQEQAQTLTEVQEYNAFGEVIASQDKAGNWRYNAYDNKGQLLYSLDAKGALTEFTYDAFGNVLSKTRYAHVLSWSKDLGSSSIAFANALLPSAYDREELYQYDFDNRLIEKTQKPICTYNASTNHYDTLRPTTRTTYNAFGEAIKVAVKRNETDWATTRYYYDKDGLKQACLDAEQYLTTYTYNNLGELTDEIQYANRATSWDETHVPPPGMSAKDRHTVFTYDALGQLTSKILKQVSYQRLINGSNRYETLVTDVTTKYTYDASGNLTSITDALGYTAYCYYNALNQLIAKVGPTTSKGRAATSYHYNALGQLIEVTRFAQGAQSADENHYVLNGHSEEDVTTHAIYDSQGRLLAEIDGLNHAIQYSYDANGQRVRSWQLISQVDGSQRLIDKRYTYDTEGHLLQTATYKNDGQLMTEDAVYNAFGEMTSKGINGNLTTHIEYDNLGRVRRSNTQGFYQLYVYDLIDHVTQIVTSTNAYSEVYDKYGVDLSSERFNVTESFDKDQWHFNLQRQNNTYDGLGRILSQRKEFTVRAEIEGQKDHLETVQQSQQVDRWGNIISHLNARGFETRYEYNAFDQVIQQELPETVAFDEKMVAHTLKPTLYYAYDALGRAIAMTDANGHTVAKILDAEGRIRTEIDAKGKMRFKNYDLFGQLVTLQNELGGLTTYTYDKANHLASVTSAKDKQTYVYDEAGELIAQYNALGQSLLFWYDNLNHQIAKKDVGDRMTYAKYDDAGHKTFEQNANNHSQSWDYDADGRLKSHTDLGGHTTFYQYNKNGLLLEETSTTGKNISYYYRGNGELLSYTDNACSETVSYSYDADGNVISKTAARTAERSDGWLRETDSYSYDALGRLIAVRRRHPNDTDNRFPEKDHALLNVDYHYDAVGNIRHTSVEANYTGYQKVRRDDFYTYDANNRMLINKGAFINGAIIVGDAQSAYLDYDEAGNVKSALKFENGALQQYSYKYNNWNQLESISKNNGLLKAIHYDAIGRVDEERLYDVFGHAASITRMIYDKDLLKYQTTSTIFAGAWLETDKNVYSYDAVGNLEDSANQFFQNGVWYQRYHHYTYEHWDSYMQSMDIASLSINNGPFSQGLSVRHYDVNGQLFNAVDMPIAGTGTPSNMDYKISTLDGIRGRKDGNGQTNYLTVAGKTIGDLRLENDGTQYLNVYGGFSPTGSQRTGSVAGYFEDFAPAITNSTADFLQREALSLPNDDVMANTPQENIGTYIVQAGDNIESIALHIYGDSSLWYLIADANGLTDKVGGLHNGQRLIIPPVAIRQHLNNTTHRVISSAELIGDTSPTVSMPTLPATSPLTPHRKSHSLFKKIAVAAVTVIATVLAAAAFVTLAGAIGASLSGGLRGLLHLGIKALTGQAMGMAGSLATGFAAGVAGSLAGQGLANALGLQKGFNLKGSLVTGLSTAASAGLLNGLSSSEAFTSLLGKFDKLSPSGFSLSQAAQMMGEDAVSQGVSLALQNHQHFSWAELGAKGALGGIAGSKQGEKFNELLNRNLGEGLSSVIHSELSALATGGLQSAINGGGFNAAQVLRENLGSAIGSGIIQSQIAKTPEQPSLVPIEIEAGEYCPIPQAQEETLTPIQETNRQLYESMNEKTNEVWNDYGDTLLVEGKLESANTESNLSMGLTTFVKDSVVNWTKGLSATIWEKGKIGNRLTGAMQAGEGAIEMTSAIALENSTLGLSTPLSYLLGIHAADKLATGFRTLATGELTPTQTLTALGKTKLSEQNITLTDDIFSMATVVGGAKRIALKIGKYSEDSYYNFKNTPLLNHYTKSVEFRSIVGTGALGGLSGAYGAFASGGNKYDIGVGALAGMVISSAGVVPRLRTIFGNPYVPAGASNLIGQVAANIIDPLNNHYSLVSLTFTLYGAGTGNFFSRHVSVPAVKMIIDSMYNWTFSGIGSDLGKRTGW